MPPAAARALLVGGGNAAAGVAARPQRARQQRRCGPATVWATSGGGGGGAGVDPPPQRSEAQEAVLARIQRAKAYKTGDGAAPKPAAAAAAPRPAPAPTPPRLRTAPPQPPAPPAAVGGEGAPLAALDQWAEQEAAKEAASFLEAMAAAAPPPAAPPQQQQQEAEQPQQQQEADQPPLPPQQQQQQQPDRDADRAFRGGGGSGDAPATWLQLANSGQAVDAEAASQMSAEQFTLAKEALQRQREVEVITVDGAYANKLARDKRRQQHTARVGNEGGAGAAAERGEDEDEVDPATGKAYKPTASGGDARVRARLLGAHSGDAHTPPMRPAQVYTWGVYPRPANISEAFGGGRNIKPGQPLESEEATAERRLRVAAALKTYRSSLGLDVDPEVEQRAQQLYNEGQALFEAGRIAAALDK